MYIVFSWTLSLRSKHQKLDLKSSQLSFFTFLSLLIRYGVRRGPVICCELKGTHNFACQTHTGGPLTSHFGLVLEDVAPHVTSPLEQG